MESASTSEQRPAGSLKEEEEEEDREKKLFGKRIKLVIYGRSVWDALRERLLAIKRAVEVQWLQYYQDNNFSRTRIYQVWPGKNVFFFHGRLVCGPDPKGLMLTVVSILLSSWIFASNSGRDLPRHSSLIVAFSLILSILVLVNLVLVSGIDPGIIPRNQYHQQPPVANGAVRSKRVTVNGVELKMKYCRVCNIFRPPRSCHCAVCDNCVANFDHHCPWIGQCISVRNYRFYLSFVVSALLFFVYVFAFTCWRIHQKMSKESWGLSEMLKNNPETMALGLFSFAAGGLLGTLSIFHLYLIGINQTAYENFKLRYVDCRNPYDKGILTNFKEALFSPLPPSRVDFLAELPLSPSPSA